MAKQVLLILWAQIRVLCSDAAADGNRLKNQLTKEEQVREFPVSTNARISYLIDMKCCFYFIGYSYCHTADMNQNISHDSFTCPFPDPYVSGACTSDPLKPTHYITLDDVLSFIQGWHWNPNYETWLFAYLKTCVRAWSRHSLDACVFWKPERLRALCVHSGNSWTCLTIPNLQHKIICYIYWYIYITYIR